MAAETVKIKMRRGVTGSDLDGNPFTASAGAEVEVAEPFGRSLVNAEYADFVTPPKQAKETATAKHQNKETR